MGVVECVPNISEGRRREVYEAVARAAAAVPGVTLLNIDPGADTNRTVITFVGEPEAVLEGAFQLVRKGVELIDMTSHRGAHPRLGAVDANRRARAAVLRRHRSGERKRSGQPSEHDECSW